MPLSLNANANMKASKTDRMTYEVEAGEVEESKGVISRTRVVRQTEEKKRI